MDGKLAAPAMFFLTAPFLAFASARWPEVDSTVEPDTKAEPTKSNAARTPCDDTKGSVLYYFVAALSRRTLSARFHSSSSTSGSLRSAETPRNRVAIRKR